MCETAADGAAIAHSAIGDAAGNLAKQTVGMVGNPPVLDVRMRDARADFEVIASVDHCGQFLDRRDVHQQIGLGEPQIQHRPERLTARQRLRRSGAPD